MRKVILLALLFALLQPACTVSVKSHGQEMVPSWVPILATVLLVIVVLYVVIRRRRK
jgi:hypothetical protein